MNGRVNDQTLLLKWGGRASSPWFVGGAHALALVSVALLILALTLALHKGGVAAVFLLDYSDNSLFAMIYPFTIQNTMHVLLALGLAELWVRWSETRCEAKYLAMHLLPEDEASILQVDDLGAVRRNVAPLAHNGGETILPRLIDVCLLQLMTNRSVEQAVAVFTSTVELISHRVELAYQSTRFLMWVIPTMGFIGTVVGIAISLDGMQDPKNIDFARVTSGLSVAFYSTILALLESAALVFFQNIVQRRQEATLNRAADYCMRNLINRTYVPRS